MARVKNKNTAPELAVRRLLWAQGVRYRLHRRDLPGTPDIYVPRLRLAIFVNGCFWHGHACPRGKLPSTNSKFWKSKIAKNRERDDRSRKALVERGITPLQLWTCQRVMFIAECDRVALGYRNAHIA
jgi:DNA mismatch endonuclease (patch repair protein)